MGAKFSAPVQTGPGAHPASRTMGTGSLPGIKRSGRGADPHPIFSAEVLNRVELYLYLRALVPCKGGTFTFTNTDKPYYNTEGQLTDEEYMFKT